MLSHASVSAGPAGSLSVTGAHWAGAEPAPERIAAIRQRTGLSEIGARVLALRWDGDDLPDATWLEPTLDHLHDPLRMRNMETALARLRYAVDRGQRIRVVTDYDVDGTTSSLILQAALKTLRPDVDISYHIPNRFGEGYGFSVLAAQQAAEDGVDLIVTADIGVRDHAAVEAARQAGVDVLICDHHLPAGADVPDGATVLCPPQAGCAYPNRSLAACGVSLKLAQALLRDHPKHRLILESLLKLAAIGTVADLVPLSTLENRAIVGLGLNQLNRGRHHPGLAALLKVARTRPGEIDTTHLGFYIGPRINAAGRVADARLVVQLLNCRDPKQAAALASELDALNDRRKQLQDQLTDELLEDLRADPPPFVVVAGPEEEGWHRGVVGIVASRVKDEVHRPAAVISIQGDTAVGSVRSVPGIHAVRALDSVADLLVKYGGHPMAAGFTVPTRQLDALRERLCSYVSEHRSEEELVPVRDYDATVPASQLDWGLLRELRRLGPFGQGNPAPSLRVSGIRPFRVQVVGQKQTTLKAWLPREGGAALEAVWFGGAEHADFLASGPVDLLGEIEENRFNGRSSLQFLIRDARPAS